MRISDEGNDGRAERGMVTIPDSHSGLIEWHLISAAGRVHAHQRCTLTTG